MENIVFNTEFFLGAGTVGVVFGGYWLWNRMTSYHDEMQRRITATKSYLEQESRFFSNEVQKIHRQLNNDLQEVNDRIDTTRSEMERDCLDRFREVDRNIEDQVATISQELTELRQEFDARIIGEARNVQRMVDRKLESQVEA